MPICTNCTHAVPYLYTVYNSQDNLRLEQCNACGAFADPYVEHDALTLWIDLILLKRDVYRHLLFNRGAGARRLSTKGAQDSEDSPASQAVLERQREKKRWRHIIQLGSVLVATDAFIRWTHLSPSITLDQDRDSSYVDIARWNQDALQCYFRILIGCLIETLGFHAGVTLASFAVLHALDWARARWAPKNIKDERSGLRQQFRYSHIPLTIFYSSLNKFFLLFLLTIWRPNTDSAGPKSNQPLAPQYNASELFTNPLVVRALTMLDDDQLDREWIVRNVLGGMATGFGLRVVLDCHPIFTTMIILAGWGVKTMLAHLVSGWVGAGIGLGSAGEGAERVAEEMWLAYSIP